jgi:hypothetical protein
LAKGLFVSCSFLSQGLAKLITLNASWAFVAPPDVLDLLRGAVARWLSRLGAVAAPSLRALRFWCPEFVYRGTARAGQLSGRGTLVLGAGEVLYAGAFEAGRRCGKGMQIDRPSGVTYKANELCVFLFLLLQRCRAGG